MLISFRSINKHVCHMQFLFLIGQFLKSSPLKPLGQTIRNLVGSIYRRSSIKSTHFVPIPLTNMATTGNSCFWLDEILKSFPLTLHGQMNRNLAGNIYGRSSIKQGSRNQAKWATFLPWIQWNRPISVKKRSFSHPVTCPSFQVCICLTNNHTFSSIFT